jgi:hypothetical protein
VDPAVEEPQAPEVTPDPAAPPVGRACANCGAPLADGQDWCLECGTAVASPRSGLPGWRTGAATIVATVVLASGAVAAAYAAITDDGSNPNGSGSSAVLLADNNGAATTDAVPQPDPIDIPSEQEVPPLAGATPPAASTQPPAAVTPPAATPPVATPPATPVTPPASTPVTPPASTPSTPANPDNGSTNDNGSSSGGGDDETPVKRAPLQEVTLTPGTTVAASYNPAAAPATGTTTTPTTPTQTTTTPTTTPTDPTQTTPTPPPSNGKVHADTDFTGDPSATFDGDPTTAWSVALGTPELIAEPQAGLLIDLGKATTLRRLVITPTTPGTTIEVYGSDAATAPATVDDKGWKKLATQLDVDGRTKITLGKDTVGTGKVRQLLIWFAAGPDDGTSTSVGISELQLYK